MKKILFALLCAGLMSLSLPVASHAEDLDMGEIKCEQLMKMGNKERVLMIFWLHGSISQQKNNTLMDQEWIQKLVKHVSEYCTKNPSETVLSSVK